VWLKTLTGSKVRVRTPGAETDKRVTVIEYVEPAHSTPPVFTRHEFIEVFCVSDGVLSFQFQGEAPFKLHPGDSVTCPAWKPHSFWNETPVPVTALLVCSPAGLDEFFIESDKLLQSKKTNHTESMAASMQRLRDQYGLEHVGEPPVLQGD
jgi:mannose-6-phosphate isomerase-like protein (cupin superfamily)